MILSIQSDIDGSHADLKNWSSDSRCNHIRQLHSRNFASDDESSWVECRPQTGDDKFSQKSQRNPLIADIVGAYYNYFTFLIFLQNILEFPKNQKSF